MKKSKLFLVVLVIILTVVLAVVALGHYFTPVSAPGKNCYGGGSTTCPL